LGDRRADERIILNRGLRKCDVRVWTVFNWLKIAPVAGSTKRQGMS